MKRNFRVSIMDRVLDEAVTEGVPWRENDELILPVEVELKVLVVDRID